MYDFCKELNGVYHDKVLDDESIKFYINGFIEAMNIDLVEGNVKWKGFDKITNIYDEKVYDSDEVEKNDEDNNLKVIFQKNKTKNKLWLKLKGMGENLDFSLDINNINKSNVKNNLPVTVTLSRMIDGVYYSMVLASSVFKTHIVVGTLPCLQDVDVKNAWLYLNRNDYEFVLKMVMKFIENPVAFVDLFDKLKNDYGMKVSGSNIENRLNDDTILDKSGKILKKVIK